MNRFLLLNTSTIKLLRIPFSIFLMPVFLLALSQANKINSNTTIISFCIIHLLVYPASNGYNSYIDKDTTSIGGIENPPLPTKQLLYITLLLDFVSVILSVLLINNTFAICIVLYIIASRAYSSKLIRLKKHALLGFLVVIIFQGGFTFYMSSVGICNATLNLSTSVWYLLIASSLQIAGAYPLTQIYQHQADANDGLITLSAKLGYRGTFIFTTFMFILCNLFYYLYFTETNQLNAFILLQICFAPIIIYFSYWFIKVLKNTSEANYKNTMRMNKIASISMIICFSILAVLQHLK